LLSKLEVLDLISSIGQGDRVAGDEEITVEHPWLSWGKREREEPSQTWDTSPGLLPKLSKSRLLRASWVLCMNKKRVPFPKEKRMNVNQLSLGPMSYASSNLNVWPPWLGPLGREHCSHLADFVFIGKNKTKKPNPKNKQNKKTTKFPKIKNKK
jgi:hypothetical protein